MTSASKSPENDNSSDNADSNQEPLSKRQRQSSNSEQSSSLVLYSQNRNDQEDDDIRTSSLSSPTLKLTGHKSSVYGLSYSSDGEYLVSSSFDMTCLIWNATGNCENVNVLSGHKNAILDVRWSCDAECIVSASADTNLGWWDANTGQRIKRFQGHDAVVNAVDVNRVHSNLVVSASDDRTVRLWDSRVRGDVGQMEHEFQCTAVAYGGNDGNTIYTGGIDNFINAWDVRKGGNYNMMMKMKGHKDTITCLALSPKGTHLLSNSMDGTLKTWDIRPFVEYGGKRHCKTFEGGMHNAEKGLLNCAWSGDGTMVTGGSADKIVHIWDEFSSEELYYLPGHSGCVNAVIFHPKENIIASASSDKSIFVGELAKG